MPGGPTKLFKGVLCREVKGLESLGVSHSGIPPSGCPPGRLGRWNSGKLEFWGVGSLILAPRTLPSQRARFPEPEISGPGVADPATD